MNKEKWKTFLSLQGNDENAPEPLSNIVIPLQDVKNRLVNYDIFNFFSLPEYKKILVIGAGGGGEVKCFIERGYDTVGTTLHWSDKKFAKNNYNIDLLLEDMHSMSFQLGYFDGVYSYHTLEHSISPLISLFEIRKVLRLGGKLHITVPRSGTAEETGLQHYSVLTEKLWGHLLDIIGFKDINIYSLEDNTIIKAIRDDKDCAGKYFETNLKNKGYLYDN